MDSSVSSKDEMLFLRVCHHISSAVYQIIPRVKHFLHKSGTVRISEWDICDWGAILAVTGPIRGNEQKVLRSSLQTRTSDATQLLPNFLPYRISRGDLH